jgi:hypothetical protein
MLPLCEIGIDTDSWQKGQLTTAYSPIHFTCDSNLFVRGLHHFGIVPILPGQ